MTIVQPAKPVHRKNKQINYDEYQAKKNTFANKMAFVIQGVLGEIGAVIKIPQYALPKNSEQNNPVNHNIQ
jgi:hypothetical protein